MTQKTIMVGLVALAFVAGSIMTGTMAEAKKDKSEGNDNNPFKALWDAIAGLQTQIDDIELTGEAEPPEDFCEEVQMCLPEGPPGEQGEQGPQGIPGPQGIQGIQGIQGGVDPGADRIILVFSSGTADGRDKYIGLGFITGFEDQASVIVPVGGTISKIWCKSADAPGTGIDEYSFDLWVNGAERQTDICTLKSTDTEEQGTVSETIFAGDTVSIFVDNTGGGASKGMSAGLIISTT